MAHSPVVFMIVWELWFSGSRLSTLIILAVQTVVILLRKGQATVTNEFTQLQWDDRLREDCRQLVQLAVREDLDGRFDVTTRVLVDDDQQGSALVVARQDGVVCGLQAVEVVFDEMHVSIDWQPHTEDGQPIAAGQSLATVNGSAAQMLTAERLILNLLGHLSGIATLASCFVKQVEGTRARIYDTRKTTPGWRRLEKFAARCGGAHNHRTGLFDAVMIKDNHLALVHQSQTGPMTPGQAVAVARRRLHQLLAEQAARTIVEIEVDTLEQLDQVLGQNPDIVLLDNMPCDQMRQAVARRDAVGASTELEASGGVDLTTVRQIAETGVERISVGAITHSALALDVAMDWQ